METLSAATNNFALDASIMSIHSENKEWLDQIDFYKDELVFFQDLIHNKKLKQHGTKQAQNVLGNLVKMNKFLVQDLDKEVLKHQKELDKLIDGNNSNDQQQRDHHRMIADKLRNFTRDYFELNRKLFDLEK